MNVGLNSVNTGVIWLTGLLAQGGDANYTGGGHMGEYGHMMGPWGAGLLMWILFIILVVVLVYFVVRPASGRGAPPQETPLDILKKRYARGEITKEQFEEMKKDL